MDLEKIANALNTLNSEAPYDQFPSDDEMEQARKDILEQGKIPEYQTGNPGFYYARAAEDGEVDEWLSYYGG